MSKGKRKRRWYQFSLRTLLVVVAVVGIFMGWFAWKMQKARKQRVAVEVIVNLGGDVVYDYQDGILGPINGTKPPSPAWLRKLLGDDFFCDVVWVRLNYSHGHDDFSDGETIHLRALAKLEGLGLDHTGVTDAGLDHLSGLVNFEVLTLEDTYITDAGLEHLKGLINLRTLSVSNTQVTGAGLKHLKGLTNLEVLLLDDTGVTDAGLEHLKGLNSLETLFLGNTQVTDEGVEQLQQALPNCRIYH